VFQYSPEVEVHEAGYYTTDKAKRIERKVLDKALRIIREEIEEMPIVMTRPTNT